MSSQNRNYNSLGKVSCLLLLLLTFLAINPVGSRAAYAVEAEDAGISPQSVLTTSSVSFSFGNPVGVTSLTPISSNGASAKYSVKATVNVTNSGGYTVYIGSNKSELTGKNTGATINTVTSSSSYDNLPLNSWGYNSVEGETAGDSFLAMPTNNRGAVIGSNNATNIKSDSKTFTLSFAAHIGNDKPADTYENTVTMSVVSSPLEVVFNGIDNLQDMTSSICSAATIGETKQLRDTRDGKYYWVTKLADGKCWMTQNLDLDLSTSTALTPATSDVAANWTPGYTTATTATSSTINTSDTGQNSWSLGDYQITNPNTSSSCGSGKNSAADCPTQFTAYTTPTSQNGDENAHYILGNHYQWNAATAGTGGTITSGTATSSICPKGWRLPTSNTGGEFEKLVAVLGGAGLTDNVTQAPLYGVRGGYVVQATTLFYYAGDSGRYWSSTPGSNDGGAYNLAFTGTAAIYPSNSNVRRFGFSVRCVAR